VLELAHDTGCSAYDCEFAAVAIALGVKLVTMDAKILRAFPGSAVALTAQMP
jgi:predicted nucleic acid-binding protein